MTLATAMQDLDSIGVKIRRDVKVTQYPFTDYFEGFGKVAAIRALFGEKTDEVLRNQKVEFYSSRFGYMGVSEDDGHILISAYHLKNSDPVILYLDVFHELHHVKQFMEGMKLFLDDFEYVDSPVEIEAYLATVKEAKRIGMTDKEIIDYLRIEWITEEQLQRLIGRMGLVRPKD